MVVDVVGIRVHFLLHHCRRGSLRLLHEQNQVVFRVAWNWNVKVHRIVELVLGLDDLFKTEVVMALFQGVEVDLLVVLGEHTPSSGPVPSTVHNLFATGCRLGVHH